MPLPKSGAYFIAIAGNDELVVAAEPGSSNSPTLQPRTTTRPHIWILEDLGNGAATLQLSSKDSPVYAAGVHKEDGPQLVALEEKQIWKIVDDDPGFVIETSDFLGAHSVFRWHVTLDPQEGELVKLGNRPPSKDILTSHWQFVPAD